MRRVAYWYYYGTVTQNNAAGGALQINIPTTRLRTGYRIIKGCVISSGNATLDVSVLEPGNVQMISQGTLAAAVGNEIRFPPPVGVAYTTGMVEDSKNGVPVVNQNYTRVLTGSVAQTQTLVLIIIAELIGTKTAPTLNTTGSGGTPSAIVETENTVVEVYES